MGKTIFVTVGTTLFDALVQETTAPLSLDWMMANSYDTLIVQHGKGSRPTINSVYERRLRIEVYDFKPTLEADMKKADLIISHAGAGTIMECLRLRKHAAVVINSSLMDDHQQELANAMGNRFYLKAISSPTELASVETWDEINSFTPEPYEGGDEWFVPKFLDRFLGMG